jgi:hypothetical protein
MARDSLGRKARPMRMDARVDLKIESYYKEQLETMAAEKGIKESLLVRRMIKASVHVWLNRNGKGGESKRERFKAK